MQLSVALSSHVSLPKNTKHYVQYKIIWLFLFFINLKDLTDEENNFKLIQLKSDKL